MGFWLHTYHSIRDYGWPFGEIKPGEVIEAKTPPEPAFFEQVDGPAETAPQVTDPAVVEIPAVEPVVTTDVPPVEITAPVAITDAVVEGTVVTTPEAPVQ